MTTGPLDRETWRQVDALFGEALDLPPEARAAFLESVRARSPELAAHVRELLQADARAAEFLERPVDEFAGGLLDDGGAEHAVSAGAVGADSPIGAWRLVREIGRGGMGVVYLAERADGQFEQRAALKIVRAELRGGGLRERFLQERSILARLEHPRIARLLDGGLLEDGRPWFAMEHVDGVPLTEYADRERLPIEERVQLFLGVCDAAAHAQTHLVVHRDLKPSNILVSKDGEPKLLDFGIAKLFTEDGESSRAPALAATSSGSAPGAAPASAPAPLTREGARLLTPEYAAPEQLRGEPVTTATDTWALGCSLFELLSGRHPFESRTGAPFERERAVLAGETEELSRAVTGAAAEARRATTGALRRRLAGDLANIVRRALAKEPGARYATAADLRADLVRWRDGLPVLARAPTFGYTARKSIARHRVAFAGAAAVLLALVAGLAATSWQARRAEREARRAARVTEFLTSLFEESDPDRAQGEPATAAELLERGAARLETELAEDPDLGAELLRTIGSLYQKLGDFERARTLHERALSMRLERFGPRHELVAESLGDLGADQHGLAQFEIADSLLARALEITRARLRADDPRLAAAIGNLAAVRHQLGRHDEAEALHREALAIDRAAHGDRHEVVAQDLSNLSTVLGELGRLEEAEAAAREALDIQRFLNPGDHTGTATALSNLSHLLGRQNRLAAADSTVAEAISMRRRLFPDGHPNLAASLRIQGDLARGRDDLAAAESAYTEALAMNRRLLGEKHIDVANGVNDLAVLAYFRRDLQAARDGFAEAAARFERALPDGHPTTLTVRSNLATVKLELGDAKGAEIDQRAILAARIRELGGEHLSVALDWRAVGNICSRGGRWEETADCYRKALAIQRAVHGDEHPDVADTKAQLARSLAALGRHEEAQRSAREAVTTFEAILPEGHTRTFDARIVLGDALLSGGKPAEALPLLRAGLEARREAFGDEDRKTADAAAWTGECLTALGRAAEGRALLESAVGALRRSRGRDDPITKRAERALARARLTP